MNTSQYIQSDSPNNPRVSAGDCWYYFDSDQFIWVLMQQKYGLRAQCIGEYENEEDTVNAMRKALGEIE